VRRAETLDQFAEQALSQRALEVAGSTHPGIMATTAAWAEALNQEEARSVESEDT